MYKFTAHRHIVAQILVISKKVRSHQISEHTDYKKIRGNISPGVDRSRWAAWKPELIFRPNFPDIPMRGENAYEEGSP